MNTDHPSSDPSADSSLQASPKARAERGQRTYVGRFAPSPTGPLHAGSMAAALASLLDARAHGGRWHVRIEDIDPPREVAGAARQILALLDACGMRGDREPSWQSAASARYEQALAQLATRGHAYRCRCSRKAVLDARQRLGLPAPASGRETVYPGTCRHAEVPATVPHAWRLNTSGATVDWIERSTGQTHHESVADYPGDFVLRRRDGLWSYQLAVVCDDAAEGVTDVVRGDDLADNTARQRLLQRLLGLPPTRYLHIPVVRNEAHEKLSKQTNAPAVAFPRTAAQTLAVLQQAAGNLGLLVTADSVAAFWPQATASWAARYRVPGSSQVNNQTES